MKIEKRKRFENLISSILKHSEDGCRLPIPKFFIANDYVEAAGRIVLEHAITKELTIEDARIVASAESFQRKEQLANLCHELGHYVVYSSKINYPLEKFLNLLKNELAADREGMRMFLRQGGLKKDYGFFLKENFHFLFSRLFSTKSTSEKWRFAKSIFINTIRIVMLHCSRCYLQQKSS